MTETKAPEVFRAFWEGAPLGLYQLLCLRSFVTHGHRVELFSYGKELVVPDWIEHRDAREILPADHVLRYQTGFGRGSPALHSNMFRCALLRQLGGWWVDCDILQLVPDAPEGPFFFASQSEVDTLCGNSVLRFPAGHPLLAEAEERCGSVGETAFWGQTGPFLLAELLDKHGLNDQIRPSKAAYPVHWTDVAALFDPARTAQVVAQCSRSSFLHLFNEVWRGAGVPSWLGPPEGSFLDAMFRKHDVGIKFSVRMRYQEVDRWIENRNEAVLLQAAKNNLHTEFKAERAAERQAVNAQCQVIAAEIEALRASTSWKITKPLRQLAQLIRGESR